LLIIVVVGGGGGGVGNHSMTLLRKCGELFGNE